MQCALYMGRLKIFESHWRWGLQTCNLGKRGNRRSGIVPLERALVSSYRLPIVTFPLSLCVSEILLLLCSVTPLFPTPPIVSSKFPHGWPLGYKEWRCWAKICLCNKFPRFATYVILIHQCYIRTDRQRDDTRLQDHASHYSASHSKNQGSINLSYTSNIHLVWKKEATISRHNFDKLWHSFVTVGSWHETSGYLKCSL